MKRRDALQEKEGETMKKSMTTHHACFVANVTTQRKMINQKTIGWSVLHANIGFMRVVRKKLELSVMTTSSVRAALPDRIELQCSPLTLVTVED